MRRVNSNPIPVTKRNSDSQKTSTGSNTNRIRRRNHSLVGRTSSSSIQGNKYSFSLLSDFENEYLCDRTVQFIESGDTKHIIALELAEQSLYFERLLRYHQEKGVIFLPEFLNENFTSIIHFIRDGDISITQDNVYKLFIASDFLLISNLKEKCQLYIENLSEDPGMALKIWITCREVYWPQLANMAFEKILKYFEEVILTNEFIHLSFDDLKLLISNDGLNCSTEMKVYEAIKIWINYSFEDRRLKFTDLMMCTRIYFMTSAEMDAIRKSDLLNTSEELKSILNTWPNCLLDSSSKLLAENKLKLLTPRIPNQIMLVFGGWCDGEGPRATAQVYDPIVNEWTLWSAVDTEQNLLGEIPRRVYAGCVLVNNRAYLIGGFDGHSALKSSLCYNFEIDSGWYEISCMYEKRYYVSVAYSGNHIYAIGGHNGDNQGRLSSAERFSIKENMWQPIAPMSRVRSDAAAAELNGKIFVCGGFDGRIYHNTTEFYNSDTNQWTLINRMVSPRGGVTLSNYNNCLYAIGGNDGHSRLRSVEKYDPNTGHWETVGTMSRRKSNLSSTVLGSNIYIIGGWSDEPESGILDLVERFDTKTSICSSVRQLCFPASATCACTLTGKNIVSRYIRRKSSSDYLLDVVESLSKKVCGQTAENNVTRDSDALRSHEHAVTHTTGLSQSASSSTGHRTLSEILSRARRRTLDR